VIVRPVLCKSFVGRREELAYLHERRREAGSSRGGLVLLSGDAGLGKSRLISEFCGSLVRSRWRIGYGLCDPSAIRPFGPIFDVIASIDGGHGEVGVAATKREQLDAFAERLRMIAARRALVVVIEDLHWADAATLDTLAYLAPRLQRMRILIVASFRPGDLHPEHHGLEAIAKIAREARSGRIDLAPLHGLELQRFIEEALDGMTLPDATRRAIAITGEGNPFFTEELLKSAVEATSADRTRSKSRRLPQTIRTTLLERLRPFDERERQILGQAAVIGRTFGLGLLATTLAMEPQKLLPPLRRARDYQLVEEVTSDTFRFRHGLTRDAIYGDFLGAETLPRHRAIAIALQAQSLEEPPLESLAFHWWAAGDQFESARYNELAGDAAARVHAHEDAIAFYTRALESSAIDAIARGSMVEKIADRRMALKMTAEAHATYGSAAEIFRNERAFDREAACRVSAAISAYTIGLANPTVPLDEMLARLDQSEFLARSRGHLGLAWLAATFWFPSRAKHHLSQVDSRALDDAPDIGLRFHNVSAWVAMSIGDIAGFRTEHRAWLDAAKAIGSIQAICAAHCNGAMCFAFFGLHEDSLDQLAQATAIAREAQFLHGQESTNAIALMCHLLHGDLERARAALDAVPTTSENRMNITFAAACGTIIGLHLGDEPMIEKWFDGFESAVSSEPEIECGAGFAEILVRRGRKRDAEDLLHRAIPECEVLRGNVLTLLAAGRYGTPADRARAREHLVRGSVGPHELPERPALALFDAIALHRDGQQIEAGVRAREAADGFRRVGMPLLEASALELVGDVAGALALYRRCGATSDVSRLDDGTSREAAGASPEMAAAAGLLSPRERQVAILAAGGLSNLEIGRELSITHKTVEKHLASVYRKLAMSSRAKLDAYVPAQSPSAVIVSRSR
jgi:DNA-binding CsgD family transcriptional regulator/tetratricopeptide (TPR) repeat protein